MIVNIQANSDYNAALARLSQLFADNQPIPDSLEEEILGLEIAINPRNWESTYKLVAAIFRQGRLPIPVTPEAGSDSQLGEDERAEIESLEVLAASAAKASDTITVFAAAWAIIFRFPNSAYGLARLSSILAERGYFDEALSVFRRVLPRKPLVDRTWRSLAEAASVIAEYQPWLAGQLLAELRLADVTSAHFANVYALEVARMAGELSPEPHVIALPSDACSAREVRLLAKHCFSVNRLQEAYDLFVRAIKLEQGDSIRDILRNFGGAFEFLLYSLDKDADIRNFLDSFFDGDCNLISAWHSPESLQEARKARCLAIERQLPSALLVTPGKCASVAVGNILSSGFNLPTMATAISTNNVIPAWATAFACGGVIHASHLRATPDNVLKLSEAGVGRVILHVRDPRQTMVSLAHHLADYRAQFGSIKGFSEVAERSLGERIDFLSREFLPDRIQWMNDWLNARDKMIIGITTYEMFVLERDRFIETLLMHYGGDTRFFNLSNANGSSGVDSHFRKGSTDEWRSVLSQQQIENINRIVGHELLAIFGWY